MNTIRISGRRLLIALAIAFALILQIGLHYYGRYQPFADHNRDAGMSDAAQSSLRITDATITGRWGGKLQWRVKARTLTLSRDRSEMTALGIHNGELIGPNGKPLFRVAAGRAIYQKPLGTLETFGNISGGTLRLDEGITGTALRRGGPTLKSPMLVYDVNSKVVRSVGVTTATFPASTQAIGGLKLRSPILLWNMGKSVLRAPGTVTAAFPDGVSRVQGEDIQVDTKSGDLTLHRLHGTFRVPVVLD